MRRFFIDFSMFEGLVEGSIASAILSAAKESELTELRLRAGKPLVVQTLFDRLHIKRNGLPYIVSKQEIDDIVLKASNFSVYSVGDEMKKGYIPYGKYRIGVAGEGVLENGEFLSVKNVSSIVVRVPHQVKSAADCIADEVLKTPLSTLVISPPGAGKTTILRELARLASKQYNTVIIDERYELAASQNGAQQLDVGEADVVSGVPKIIAYENCVRAMNPDIIVTDEVFREREVEAICDIARSGVKVFASLHGYSINDVRGNRVFAPMSKAFEFAVVLTKKPRAGTVVETVRI